MHLKYSSFCNVSSKFGGGEKKKGRKKDKEQTKLAWLEWWTMGCKDYHFYT